MLNYTNEQLINKIADIRDIIPVEMFHECHPSVLSASVGYPYECLCYIEEIVKNLIEENLRLEKDNFQQNEEIAKLWDKV
jgi:hypothetical protein